MTIYAGNLNRGTRLVVKNSITMCVLPEMAVNAVHSFFEMNVVEVHRLLEAVGIVRRNNVIVGIKQVAFTVAFEDLAKQPPVPVKIRELGSLKLPIEFRRPGLCE